MKENLALCLQLFAEGADGGTAQFTGDTEAAAAPQATGEETASDAGMQNDRKGAFEKLIKGEFKQEYDDRVRDTVQKRLKEHKALQEKMETLAPALEKLAGRYGLDPADTTALARALEQAGEAEISTPQVQARQQYDRWMEQAEQTGNAYPQFDLRRELADPRFTRLLQADVDIKTAYEVLHGQEHFAGALAFATQQMEKVLGARLSAAQNRPAENGMASGSAAVVRQDVSQMSRSDRAEIIRRVQRGETIRF